MRDTAHLEHTTEDYVSFKLQHAGFLIAKPKFDRDGTDLIALLSVKDGAKFGRIQCKGRSLKKHKSTNIKVPCEYVIGPFFVFVYIDYEPSDNLFVFFREDIKKWKKSKSEYVLNITRTYISDNVLNEYLFSDSKIELIKTAILRTTSDLEKEMFRLLSMSIKADKLRKKADRLKTLVDRARAAEADKKMANMGLENAYLEIKLLAERTSKEIDPEIVDEIKKAKEAGRDEEDAFDSILAQHTTIESKVLWLLIVYLYDSVEKNFSKHI